jgi:hypothetical protein
MLKVEKISQLTKEIYYQSVSKILSDLKEEPLEQSEPLNKTQNTKSSLDHFSTTKEKLKRNSMDSA